MCKKNFGAAGAVPDAKSVKESCAALKEAAALSAALQKEAGDGARTLRIVFEGETEDYAL